MTVFTADLCDKHPEIQVCDAIFSTFGRRHVFHGQIKTLKVFEDNALVRRALETQSEGAVLVVDGGGSLRCALLGGDLGRLAATNRWAGVVIYGCVRDSSELAECDLGVMALGANPRKSEKGLHGGRADGLVRFAGVSFRPGAWLYADADGIVVADSAVHR